MTALLRFIMCGLLFAISVLAPVAAYNEEFFTVFSTLEPMSVRYEKEDQEAMEAPPVYKQDPRTKRQLTEMLRMNPYAEEDRDFFYGLEGNGDAFLRRAWSRMRRNFGAIPREPTRPFAKRHLFARLAPIPVFMITDWQGEPQFFEPENELDPSYCPIYFDHADAEAAMYEMFTLDPGVYSPTDEEELRLTALSLDEALITTNKFHEQQAHAEAKKNETAGDVIVDFFKEVFVALVPEPFLPKYIRREREQERQEFLDDALRPDSEDENRPENWLNPYDLALLQTWWDEQVNMKSFPEGSLLGRRLWAKYKNKDKDEILEENLKAFERQQFGDIDDEGDAEEENDDDDDENIADEKPPLGLLPEDEDVSVYDFVPSTRQFILGQVNKVKLATPDAFEAMPLYFVEGMQVRHGFRKVLPYYMSYDDCAKKYAEARQEALRRGADLTKWPEKAPVQADSFRSVALAIDDGCGDFSIVPDSKQLEFIKRNLGKDQLARIYPTSQEER